VLSKVRCSSFSFLNCESFKVIIGDGEWFGGGGGGGGIGGGVGGTNGMRYPGNDEGKFNILDTC